jgi:SAM-dependent methyltransferase
MLRYPGNKGDFMSGYLMEDPLEAERLEIKTKKENILKELEYLSLEPGMRVLDAGCGTGAVTRILAEKVFPGCAVGLDFSPQRLGIARGLARQEKRENIRFVSSDLLAPGLKPGWFDVAFSRCCFQYLPGDRGRSALRAMKGLVRPGGKVVVADLDHVCLHRVPHDEGREKALELLLERVGALGFDSFVGPKLYGMFLEEGFRDIRVDLLPYYLIAGKADPNTVRVWEMKVQILDRYFEDIFGSKETADEVIHRFLDDFHREDVLLYNSIFLVQGIR